MAKQNYETVAGLRRDWFALGIIEFPGNSLQLFLQPFRLGGVQRRLSAAVGTCGVQHDADNIRRQVERVARIGPGTLAGTGAEPWISCVLRPSVHKFRLAECAPKFRWRHFSRRQRSDEAPAFTVIGGPDCFPEVSRVHA